MPERLRLISHKLCPFVQRAVIVAKEKDIAFERVNVDLANKPDWFLKISPTGKVPVLEVTERDGSTHILFESSVIAEYLDEIAGAPLLPREPLERARQRAWVEFASATIMDIGKLYAAPYEAEFETAKAALENRGFDVVQRDVAGFYSRHRQQPSPAGDHASFRRRCLQRDGRRHFESFTRGLCRASNNFRITTRAVFDRIQLSFRRTRGVAG